MTNSERTLAGERKEWLRRFNRKITNPIMLTFAGRFGCQLDARSWAGAFFDWYNNEHHHSGLGLLTPADVHFGRAQAVLERRQQVLAAAYQKNPERFVKGLPTPQQLPIAVWINPPRPAVLTQEEIQQS